MTDSTQSPTPARPVAHKPLTAVPSAPDPADLGTAYGMEMSIDTAAEQAPVDVDLDDPLSWIRHWVDRHKTA